MESNKNSDKTFIAYISNTPLRVLGLLECNICIGKNAGKETISVIKEGTKNVLGKSTAKALVVLKIGLEINNVTEFLKFKDITVSS